MNPEVRVRARRRIAMRLGFAALVVASATACIFDSGGDYQKGGRIDKGATANSGDPPAPRTDAGGSTPTDSGSGAVDASTGG